MRRFAVTEVDRFFEPFTPLECWEIHRYLGSMLVLQLGDQVCLNDGRSIIYEGECKIGLRDVSWAIMVDGQMLTDSATLNDAVFKDQVRPLVESATLLEVKTSEDSKSLLMIFNRDLILNIDLTNKQATTLDILEATLPDGQIIVIEPESSLFLLEEISEVRAAKSKIKRVQ